MGLAGGAEDEEEGGATSGKDENSDEEETEGEGKFPALSEGEQGAYSLCNRMESAIMEAEMNCGRRLSP
jgi:hypothetical protein